MARHAGKLGEMDEQTFQKGSCKIQYTSEKRGWIGVVRGTGTVFLVITSKWMFVMFLMV